MPLVLEFTGDAKRFERVLDKAVKSGVTKVKFMEKNSVASASKMSMAFGKFGGILGALSFAVAAKGISHLIGLASDTTEATNKVREVFGEAAQSVEDFAKRGATALGASRRETLQMTGEIGNLLVAQGLQKKAAAALSKQVVQNAADIGSFNNALTTDVLVAYRAALVGSSEPMLRFGVDTRVTRLEQIAFETGITKTIRKLGTQEKALAAIAAVQKDTRIAAGDFARTSDDLANSTKILAAQWEDFSTTLGKLFIPVATDVVSSLRVIIGETAALADGTKELDVDWQGAIGTLLLSVPGLRELGASMVNASVEAGHLGTRVKVLKTAFGDLKPDPKVKRELEDFFADIEIILPEFVLPELTPKQLQKLEKMAAIGKVKDKTLVTVTQQAAQNQERIAKASENALRGMVAITPEFVELAETSGIVQTNLDLSVSGMENLKVSASNFLDEMTAVRQEMAGLLELTNNLFNLLEEFSKKKGSFFGTLLGFGPGAILSGGDIRGAFEGAKRIPSFAGTGFQEGGSFTVQGSGFHDRPVFINAAPGERVDITPRRETERSLERPAAKVEYHLHFPGANRVDEQFILMEVAPVLHAARQRGDIRSLA